MFVCENPGGQKISTRQAGNQFFLPNFQTYLQTKNKRNKRNVKVKHSYPPKHLNNNNRTSDVSLQPFQLLQKWYCAYSKIINCKNSFMFFHVNFKKQKVDNFLRRVGEKRNSPGQIFANKAIFFWPQFDVSRCHLGMDGSPN